MAVVDPIILQVVGFQNSGKTTLLSKIITQLSEKGMRVATIKHHGHGGKPDLIHEKDSSKHIEAGAHASLVEGKGRVILHAEQPTWNLEQQIKLVSALEPDIILIEGHKMREFPKVVLLRDEKEDLPLIEELVNIKAVFYWHTKSPLSYLDIPCFPIKKEEEGLNWIIKYLIDLRRD
jgi:molybdopterin-guanine dinucleotide biosynthesis adapter protein